MKGWVYVISNKAMPGLVKVGHSTKDPERRAEELNHTGSPHPYLVEYWMLIEEPYQIEQQTHKLLYSKREAKEWFRCTAEEAVVAIKQVAGSRAIIENNKRVDRAKTEALHQQAIKEQEDRRAREKAEKEIEERLRKEESIIREKFHHEIEATFPPRPLWIYWVGVGFLILAVLTIFFPKVSGGPALLLLIIGGGIAGIFLRDYFEKKRKQSTAYLLLEKQRDEELAMAYNNGGRAYFLLGNYNQAMKDYNKAIDLNAKYVEAYTGRGDVYRELCAEAMETEDYNKARDQAIENFDRAIELNPKYANAYYSRGLTNTLDSHDDKQAIRDFDKAIELNPKYADAYSSRGVVYAYLGNAKEAIKDSNKAIELNPKDADAYHSRSNVYLFLGNYKQAYEEMKIAARLRDKGHLDDMTLKVLRELSEESK